MFPGCVGRLIPLGLVMILIAAQTSFPQSSTGSLNGVVTDPTGSVILNAVITLKNQETGAIRSIQTNSSGYYALNNVTPGSYTLAASKQGFDRIERRGILLGVNEILTFNLEMQVGSRTEVVTVEDSAAQVERSSSELGTVIGSQPSEDLPLNGREFTRLLMLTPGASRLNTAQNNGGSYAPSGPGPIFQPAMHGQDNRNNFFMIDGVDDNEDFFGTFSLSPTVDDIAEFKVQAHNDSAQFGMTLGGVINVVTKAGTNRVHGTMWEFNRNQALGALNPITRTDPALNQNQFGGSIGGPLLIPHVYNGRNRTFVYFSYEGFRKTQNAATLESVLTQDELNGDFSGFSATTQPIYDPFVLPRTPFPGNRIDPSTFNQAMVTYAKLLLPIAPAGSPVSNNFTDTTPSTTHQNDFNGRLDETLNDRNSFWFRYSRMDQLSVSSTVIPGLLDAVDITPTNYGVNYLHTFNNSTTLNLEFGHNMLNYDSQQRYSEGSSASLVQQIGYSGSFACGYARLGANTDCLVPTLNITGYFTGGENSDILNPVSDVFQYSGDFSKLAGRHFVQAGATLYIDSMNLQNVVATVGFTSTGTASSANTGGNALASFLLGVVDNSKDRATIVPVDGQKEVGGYVQDQWKILPNLTLNAGIRYDVALWPRYGSSKNLTDAIGEIDFSNGTYILQRSVGDCATLGTAPCIPGGLASQPDVIVSSNGRLWATNYDNIQPRIGFALTLHGGTVLRGGYGIYFDEWSGARQTVQGIGGDWPSVAQPSAQNQDPVTAIPTVSATDPLNVTTSLPAATPFTQSTYYRDPHAQNPKSYQYNVGIQQILDAHTTFDIEYVGSQNTRLPVGGNLYNVATYPAAGTATQVAARRPYPNITPTRYDRSVGYGNYNGLEIRLASSLSRGFQYIVSYTWSKTMDLACDGLFGVEGCSEQNPYALRDDYSVSGYDLPNNLSVSATWEIPLGRGQLIDIHNPVASRILGGWQVNGIYAMTSGMPFTITTSGDFANTGNTNEDRGEQIGDPKLASPSRNEWFNTAAFTTPALYTFGNSGRNELRGQTYNNLDASVFKNVSTGRETQIEFRLEAFNALNHLTLGTPGNNVSTPSSFGVINSERSTERQVQVAVKYVF